MTLGGVLGTGLRLDGALQHVDLRSEAVVVGLLWSVSTIVADVLAARLLQGLSWRLAAVHFRFWDGYLFALVPLAQLIAPAIALRVLRRSPTTA